MNIFKNLKLRYYVFKDIQGKLYPIRLIRKRLDILKGEYRLDPNDDDVLVAIENCQNEEKKWHAIFGRSVLILIGVYPLPEPMFDDEKLP